MLGNPGHHLDAGILEKSRAPSALGAAQADVLGLGIEFESDRPGVDAANMSFETHTVESMGADRDVSGFENDFEMSAVNGREVPFEVLPATRAEGVPSSAAITRATILDRGVSIPITCFGFPLIPILNRLIAGGVRPRGTEILTA